MKLIKTAIKDANGRSQLYTVSEEVYQIIQDNGKFDVKLFNERRRHRISTSNTAMGFSSDTSKDESLVGTEPISDYDCLKSEAFSPSAENEFFRNEMMRHILTVVATCTLIQQRRFHMHFIEGFSYTEISSVEMCNPNAIRYSVLAVIKKIRKNLPR